MDTQLLQIPAELVKAEMRSLTKDAKLTFTTQEAVKPELLMQIISKTGETGWLSFLVGARKLDTLDVIHLPEIAQDKGEKTKAQRLRAVIHIYWEEQKKEGLTTATSEEFYGITMEKFIDHIKSKLPKE